MQENNENSSSANSFGWISLILGICSFFPFSVLNIFPFATIIGIILATIGLVFVITCYKSINNWIMTTALVLNIISILLNLLLLSFFLFFAGFFIFLEKIFNIFR